MGFVFQAVTYVGGWIALAVLALSVSAGYVSCKIVISKNLNCFESLSWLEPGGTISKDRDSVALEEILSTFSIVLCLFLMCPALFVRQQIVPRM